MKSLMQMNVGDACRRRPNSIQVQYIHFTCNNADFLGVFFLCALFLCFPCKGQGVKYVVVIMLRTKFYCVTVNACVFLGK